MINHTKSGSGGRLYNRIRFLEKIQRVNQNSITPQTPPNENNTYSMNHLLWLKTVVVSDTNIEEIRTKLTLTRAHRDEIVSKDSVELMQEFPFFFTYPLLVRTNEFLYFDFIRLSLECLK